MLKIGKTKIKLQSERDFNFLSHSEPEWELKFEIKSNLYHIHVVKDGYKLFLYQQRQEPDFSMFKLICIDDKNFAIRDRKNIFFFYFKGDEWKQIISCGSRSHLSEKGFYYENNYSLRYIDFETSCETILGLDYNPQSYIFFHKKFIVARYFIHSNFYIYVNPKDLPSGIDIKFLKKKKFVSKEHSRKINVNFKDDIKIIEISQLNLFNSSFIQDQLKSSNEIYLDLNFEDFNLNNPQTLIYLNSQSSSKQNLYRQQILKLILSGKF